MTDARHKRTRQSAQSRFEKLVRPHFDALYRAAARLTASPDDAEDLVQEVCMKAYVRLADLESIEHHRSWLLRVLYTVFIDSKRREQRSPNDGALGIDDIPLAADARLQPEVATDEQFSLDMLLSAMNILNREHCALLALHDIEGYTLAELEALTGLTQSNIKSRLHRTRAKLGRLLKRETSGRPHLTVVRC